MRTTGQGFQGIPQAAPWSADVVKTSFASFSAVNYAMLGGSVAVVLASMLPFVSLSGPISVLVHADIGTMPRLCIALYGLAMVGVTFLVARGGSRRGPVPIVQLCMASLAIMGFLLFLAVGSAGVSATSEGGFADVSTSVGYSPNVGLLLAIAGCGVVIGSAVQVLRRPAVRG